MKAHLTGFARLRTVKPMITGYCGSKFVVTNWAATRVFSSDGKALLHEAFHTKKVSPRQTHDAVVSYMRYVNEMTANTPNAPGLYQGD